MSATQGSSGFGTLLKRGDGGVGAGVKASRTMGTSDAQLIVGWNTAGTVGNAKTVEVIENGTSTPLSVTVSTTAVVINLETDGSDASVSTVNDVIAALYANETFRTYWFANSGAGDGTGVLDQDYASAALSGGTNGTEVFTTIAEVTNISGPTRTFELIDATHMESPDGYREYLPSLKDGGEISFDLNFLPGDANQNGLIDDLNDRVRRNFEIHWTNTDSTYWSFSGYVTNFEPSAQIDDKLSASCTIKITGSIASSFTP